MRPSTLYLPTLASLHSVASAHGYLTGVRINGVFFKGFTPKTGFNPVAVDPTPVGWTAANNDLGFVSPDAFQTSNMNCHKNATAAKAYAHANAGDTIEFVWNQWIASHKGPIVNYVAPCDGDCSTRTSSSLRWTKFSQDGLITPGGEEGLGYWITDELMHSNFTAAATLPKNLKPGNYVLRHEIIALHGARQENGAQAYPQCVNIEVGGSGQVAPVGGVAGIALYEATDPGIKFDIYARPTSYPLPGPALWTEAE